jgi:Leucine-rich repeat (LRR) protein
LAALQALDLSRNSLPAAPLASWFAAIGPVPPLRTLSLRANPLSGGLAAGTLEPVLDTLERLDLSSAGLTEIPLALLGNATFGRLTSVDFHNNTIEMLPSALYASMPATETMCARLCKLLMLNLHFTDRPRLYSLLHSNWLSAVPDGLFSELTQLQAVYLQSNFITELPVTLFSAQTQLNTLNLDFNNLAAIPAGLFDDCYQLASLYGVLFL